MCGIVGQLRLGEAATPVAPPLAAQLLARLAHRGPDGQGQWRSGDARCWLGHTRLSIIDLATGAQPMTTPDEALAITYNGEIYNYRELRVELERAGQSFRTHSDTEVILLGYRQWGGMGLLRRLQGLFAFGLYDARERSLFLARDHAGVKPLFWWSDGAQLLFASEMKALLAFPELQASRRARTGTCRPRRRPSTSTRRWSSSGAASRRWSRSSSSPTCRSACNCRAVSIRVSSRR